MHPDLVAASVNSGAVSAGEAGVSCRGWQHLWVSLVKFSDSVPLGITELMSSGDSKSTLLVKLVFSGRGAEEKLGKRSRVPMAW